MPSTNKVYNKVALPTLYSLQHCPFAMRARLALLMSKQDVLLRAIVTKDKPKEMLQVSPKGTVPILILTDGTIIDESLDIMTWALQQNDPEDLLYKTQPQFYTAMLNIISICDTEFRKNLSAYKHAKRYHQEKTVELEIRGQCELFIQQIETCLQKNLFIMGEKLSICDLAVLPNIRQFANVDRKWFRQADYPKLINWLRNLMQSQLFCKAMRKYPLWNESNEEFIFTWN